MREKPETVPCVPHKAPLITKPCVHPRSSKRRRRRRRRAHVALVTNEQRALFFENYHRAFTIQKLTNLRITDEPSDDDEDENRRLNRSDTESANKMPIGFENSALKSSFSLSSLQPCTPPGSPDNVKSGRPYDSLPKKARKSNRRERENLRRSWGSVDKESWHGFQCDYEYLMSQNLLDPVSPVQDARPPTIWTYSQFLDESAQFYSWLNTHDENQGDEMSERLEQFTTECEKLVEQHPQYQEEVCRTVDKLNEMWGTRGVNDETGEVERELKNVRKWVREMETKLKPLDFRIGWTTSELERKTNEHLILQREIEAHGKIINTVLRLCEKSDTGNQRIARSLQRRYLQLFLKSVEWQCHIEDLSQRQLNESCGNSDNDEEGPPTKIRRIASDHQDFIHEEPILYLDEDYLMEIPQPIENISSQLNVSSAEADMVRSRPACYGVEEQLPKVAESIFGMEASCEKSTNSSVGFGEPPSDVNGYTDGVELYYHTDDNRSKPSNCATFHFKHVDTDSEPEKQPVMSDGDKGAISSEEEWTYVNKPSTDTDTVTMDSSAKYDGVQKQKKRRDSIKELVNRAEELVRTKQENGRIHGKNAKVKEWLSDQQPLDSCDASGEYTTEDSDNMSSASEDLDGSIATCRRTGSADGILDETFVETNTVLYREKRSGAARPWSISSAAQLLQCKTKDTQTQWSISESALHQIDLSPICKEKLRQMVLNGKESKVGSSVENCGSLRRRKIRLKKRSHNRKSESGSEHSAATASPTDCHERLRGIVKSGSFSGCVRRQLFTSDRYVTSEPVGTKYDSTSGTETEELKPPVFRIGKEVSAAVTLPDCEKTPAEEQLSLNSDQAWDTFQEKYLSEGCSEELPDPLDPSKLLNFGDDYSKFIDSQSDCSSFSGVGMRRRTYIDSDSDLEELKYLMEQSEKQLSISDQLFYRAQNSAELMRASDLNEILETCKQNIRCLNVLLSHQQGRDMLSTKERKDINSLIDKWECLQKKCDNLQKVLYLQDTLEMLKTQLLDISRRSGSLDTNIESKEELEVLLVQVKADLNTIRDNKAELTQLNVSVHRCISDNGSTVPNLKENVVELYRIWDDTFQRVSRQLCVLQRLSQAWHEFDNNLIQLNIALQTDEDTLRMLDTALRCGASTPDLAMSVRDVAKVLSDKDILSTSTFTLDDSIPNPLVSAISTEGSLSDSGISDSGSELDLSEREKRLAGLKRLARHLESILAPGSAILASMSERIDKAEAELRHLQKTCRELIIRSAVCAEVKVTPISPRANGKRKTPIQRRGVSGSPDSDPGKPGRPWFWRVIRSALPFQLAMVALLCVACLLEPHCCDALNNLGMSFSPQVRYVRGPPPV